MNDELFSKLEESLEQAIEYEKGNLSSEEVKTYEVYDEHQNFKAIFFADFHPRAGKRDGAWMTLYKNQFKTETQNERPQVSIVCNFSKPTKTQPSLLTFNEVTTLFHEFGHCFLNRTHTNEILPNGEWKSLMRGGTLPNNRSYVINFRGFRKDFYWDELFDPETSTPEWATRSQKLNIDEYLYTEITKLSDPKALSQDWDKPDSSHANYIIEDSGYTINNLSNQKLAVTSVSVPVISTSNFIIDSKVGFKLSEAEEGIGLMFGERDSLDYIAFTPRLGLKLGNLSQFRPYVTIPLNSNRKKEWHKITIQKKQHELLYFINDELVYHKSAGPFVADSLYVGYYVAPNNTLDIADVEILWQ